MSTKADLLILKRICQPHRIFSILINCICAFLSDMTCNILLDIDECSGKDGSSLCTDPKEYCSNTPGGFECERKLNKDQCISTT